MMQRKRKLLIALSTLCLGAAAFGLLRTANSDTLVTVKAASDNPTTYRVENGLKIASGYDSAKYSTVDAINVYRKAAGVTVSSGDLDIRLPISASDLSDVVSIYTRYCNPTEKTVETVLSLVDENDVVCAWKYNPTTSTGYEPDKFTGTEEVTQATANGVGVQNWYYTKILAGDDCWYAYDMAESQTYPNATAYNTSLENTFDATKAKYILVRVAANYSNCQVNVGEVYGKKADGTFVKLFDPTLVTSVGTQTTNDVYVSVKDATVSNGTLANLINDYEVATHRADEIKLGDNVTQAWYGFSLPNTSTDLSAYNGIRYTVDLTNCGNIYVNKFLTDTSNKYQAKDSNIGSVALLRKLLGEATEKVSLVIVGPMSNIAGLLQSTADEYSPLDGKTLVGEKVDKAYIMGGSFNVGELAEKGVISKYVFSEWNVLQDIASARYVAEYLPCETLFVPHEAGYAVWTKMLSGDNPVWECMKQYAISENFWNGKEFSRHSWDPITALCPLMDLSKYFIYSEYGYVTIDEHGTTRFEKVKGGKDRYLIPRENYHEVAEIINDWVEKQ